jgi:hypothetical protein
MEALTRLVSDSLARHGLDRPVDPRRLQWSRWFRCDSLHSLLVVPSKPGIFAIAEEIANLSSVATDVGTAALGCSAERSSAAAAAEGRRMLAVIQFSEDDNMAFILDRMFTYVNPMRTRLHAGNCFVRFVVVEDGNQRRSICAALNQWMRSSAERASCLPAEFSSSVEMAFEKRAQENVMRAPSPASWPWGARDVAKDAAKNANADPGNVANRVAVDSVPEPISASSHLESGARSNLHCPQPFPSGF